MFDNAAYQRQWRRDNKDACAQTGLLYKQNNPEKMLFWSAKTRANARNLAFNIELSDIQIPKICPVFGIPIFVSLAIGRVQRNRPNSPSLDRIKPELGYVKGNVRVISWRANDLKSNGSLEEMRLIVADLEK